MSRNYSDSDFSDPEGQDNDPVEVAENGPEGADYDDAAPQPNEGGGQHNRARNIATEQASMAKHQGQQIAGHAKDRLEHDAAVAQEQGKVLLDENKAALTNTKDTMVGGANAARDFHKQNAGNYRDPAVQAQAAAGLMAARSKGQAMYAQNKAVVGHNLEARDAVEHEARDFRSGVQDEVVDAGRQQVSSTAEKVTSKKSLDNQQPGVASPQQQPAPGAAASGGNAAVAGAAGFAMQSREAAGAARREAERNAQMMHAQATVVGQQVGEKGAQYATAAVDIARGEFDARWNKCVEQEGKLTELSIEVEKREKQLNLMLSRGEPNWPCKCGCITPIVHHDIVGDIPTERAPFVRKNYINYFITIFLLISNFAFALTMLFIDNKKDENGNETVESDPAVSQHCGVSGVFLMGIIFSFMIWYWPLYKACGTGSSANYWMAFIGLIVACMFNILCTIGPVGFGGCGILYALEINKTKGRDSFIPAIIMAILWFFQLIFFLFVLFRLRKYYSEDKASLARARAEMFASEVRSALTGA